MKTTARRTMEAADWVPASARAILDVGCNVGELLSQLNGRNPDATLAGCDVNAAAVDAARRNVPDADIRLCGAADLPYADGEFDCVTCIETLEHVPPAEWETSLRSMGRVLKPGGGLVLRTPHAGLFAWLDSNNVRFRTPGLYRRLLGRGRRDGGYPDGTAGIHWHHHFTRRELLALAGPKWTVEATRYGGCFLLPLGDFLLWPFYRTGRSGGALRRMLEWMQRFDYAIDYGDASYGILLALKKPE